MTTPSYARSTSASLSKGTPKAPRAKQIPTSSKAPHSTPTTPPKLKRPSTLTPKKRQSIAYNATLIPIKPHDPTKPCLLATLPSEIRTEIWTYLLDMFHGLKHPRCIVTKTTKRLCYVWPDVLHICRGIRIEAAYTYYTTCPFYLGVRNVDFSNVMKWLGILPVRHRELVQRNRNLQVEVKAGLKQNYTYPPEGFLLDDWVKNHWKACRPFGNLYLVPSSKRLDFVIFCRLLAWFQFNSVPLYRGMHWRYRFETLLSHRYFYAEGVWLDFKDFLEDNVSVLRRDWSKVWLRGSGKGKGVEEAKEFLRQLDVVFWASLPDEARPFGAKWEDELEWIRKAIEKW